MYIQYVYIALKCFHRCRFSRKAEVKWHFCLICVKPLILFSSCGLQKVGWWVAPWSKIQRPHRPFLKSAWYLVTYITPMLLHLITSNRRLIHTPRGCRPLESVLNTRSVEPFQLNHDSQAGIDSIKTAPTWQGWDKLIQNQQLHHSNSLILKGTRLSCFWTKPQFNIGDSPFIVLIPSVCTSGIVKNLSQSWPAGTWRGCNHADDKILRANPCKIPVFLWVQRKYFPWWLSEWGQ